MQPAANQKEEAAELHGSFYDVLTDGVDGETTSAGSRCR